MKVLILVGMIASISAMAEISPPDRGEGFSRAFQQAKRVATLQSQQEIPSRAYWLSTRLVKNIKKTKTTALKQQKQKNKKNQVSTEN